MPNPHSEPQEQTRTRRCRHIFSAGRQCGSPCLRTEQFCYFHHTTRRPVSDPKARRVRVTTYDLPVPEDRDSIRAAVAQVMHDIANNHIDPRRAGLILYSLQIALCAMPKEPVMHRTQTSTQPKPLTSAQYREHYRGAFNASADTRRKTRRDPGPIADIPAEPIIEETVLDAAYGLIAPETFLDPEDIEQEEEEEKDQWCDPGDEVLPGGRLLRNTLGYKLLKDVELYESRTQGWYRGRVDAFNETSKTAAAAADQGATAAEIAGTLATAAAKAAVEQAEFTAQVAAGMAKSPFYTGKDPDEDADAEDAPAPELEPWESPILPNLNASAHPGVFCHFRRESAVPTSERSGEERTGARVPHPCAASSRMGGKATMRGARSKLYRTAPLIASSN